jgi:signal transduction histidine kinase
VTSPTADADADELIAGALETAREQLAMDIGYFSEFVGGDQIVRGVRGDGASFGLLPDARVSLADSYCQRVVDGRVPSAIPDTSADPRVASLSVTAEAAIGAYVGVPLELPDGRLYGTLCCASHGARPDLTDRDVGFLRVLARLLAEHLQRQADHQRFTARLAQANAELEAFAQVAAHDLTEPMRTVSGLLQLLERRLGDDLPAGQREIVDLVVAEAGRMETLVDSLLALARAGGAAVAEDAVDLGAVAREAVDTLGAGVSEAGARVELGELPTVLGDATQLRQLVQNLVANALRYTAEDPPVVRVEAVARGDGWEVAVTDNGVGVADEDRERIFRPFARGVDPQGRPGTGLGLATCAKIVARHGGRLWVEPAPGGGSRFAFTLRAAR